jgi:hypothetical protein
LASFGQYRFFRLSQHCAILWLRIMASGDDVPVDKSGAEASGAKKEVPLRNGEEPKGTVDPRGREKKEAAKGNLTPTEDFFRQWEAAGPPSESDKEVFSWQDVDLETDAKGGKEEKEGNEKEGNEKEGNEKEGDGAERKRDQLGAIWAQYKQGEFSIPKRDPRVPKPQATVEQVNEMMRKAEHMMRTLYFAFLSCVDIQTPMKECD